MANDFGNTEFDHLNQLAKQFGIQFNKDSRKRVPGNDYAMGLMVAVSNARKGAIPNFSPAPLR